MVINNVDLFPFLRCGLIVTNLTCGKARCVDGFARLLTKSDVERCKGTKLRQQVQDVESLLQSKWGEVFAAPQEKKHIYYKAFGKCCIRAILLLTGKWKMGRENKEYKDIESIKGAYDNELASSTPTAQLLVTSQASQPSQSSKAVDLQQAKNPMFLAMQSIELKIGNFYNHKDLPHIFLLKEINADHLVLEAQELFENTKKTITVQDIKVTKELKPSKGKAPALIADDAAKLTPTLVCREENDRAYIYGVLFSMCKSYHKKVLIQEDPVKRIYTDGQAKQHDLTMVPMTDKVDKIVLKSPGQLSKFAKVSYGGTEWYILPPKPWKCVDGTCTGLVVPFWVACGTMVKEDSNMAFEMKDVKGLKVQVLSNPKQLPAKTMLSVVDPSAAHSSKGKGRSAKREASGKAPAAKKIKQ